MAAQKRLNSVYYRKIKTFCAGKFSTNEILQKKNLNLRHIAT